MALAKNRRQFSNVGGGELRLRELVSAGVAATMEVVSYLDKSGLNIDPKMVQWNDERGFVINALPGGEEWRFKTGLMQSNIDIVNLVKNSRNKFYYLYYKGPTLEDGTTQEIFIPCVKIISPFEKAFKAPDKSIIEVEFLGLMPKAAVTVTPSALNVAVNTYGTIYESSSPVGQVTTTNGDLWTAVI